MQVPAQQFSDLMSVLAGILKVGNITFGKAGGAQVSDKSALEAAASCLSVESFRLSDALTQKFMKLRGEEITTPLTLEQVRIIVVLIIIFFPYFRQLILVILSPCRSMLTLFVGFWRKLMCESAGKDTLLQLEFWIFSVLRILKLEYIIHVHGFFIFYTG